MSNFKISVVIATYHRQDILEKTLRCLARQTLPVNDYEVVVVDDGSPDDTEARVRKIQGELPYALTYLRHPNAGICHTQNRGIMAAKAPIVCLIADDIHMTPEALEQHLADHSRHPEPQVAILGLVLQSPELPGTVFHRHWDPFRLRELCGLREVPCYQFFACNVSFKKEFMLAHGMFDEELVKADAYAHEDVELGYRLCRGGMRLLFNERALAYHYHLVPMEQAINAAYKKGLSWPRFREAVGEPELTIRYHVLHKKYLRDYSVLRKKDGHQLMGIDANPLLLFISQLLRIAGFNRVTVPFFWLPLMRAAESSPFLAGLMHRQMYRCAISYFFHRGVAAALKNHDA